MGPVTMKSGGGAMPGLPSAPQRVGGRLRWFCIGLTTGVVATLVVVAGRVYTGAILHTGPTLKLRNAWRGAPTPVA